MNSKELIILGKGGHAAACADLAFSIGGFQSIRMLDADEQEGFLRKMKNSKNHSSTELTLGVGMVESSPLRRQIVDSVAAIGEFRWATLIAQSSTVSKSSQIGEGCQIFPGSVVGAGVRIGRFTIVNSGSIVEHGSVVGDYCHISTGAVVNGDCFIGDESFLGSGSLIRQGIKIPHRTFIRMGERVTQNLATD